MNLRLNVKLSIACSAALLAVLAGCAPMQVAPTPQDIASHVGPGDQVHVMTRNGSADDYRVLRVDSADLFVEPLRREDGEDPNKSIVFGDIAHITVTRPAEGLLWAGLRNAALVAEDVLGVLLEAAAAVPFSL